MAGHEWEDWFEREEFIGQISDMRVQNLQVEREVVQKRTFTRWMNLHLEKCDPPIEVQDLFRDIQDGHILMALLEELSGCKLLQGFKKSSHRIFRLNNIAKVLSFLEERNVKLVSIDAADVADGNSSIILGLIWNIILFFQIKELTGNIRSQFPSCSSLSSIPTSSDSDTSFCSTPSNERQSASTAMREHGKAIKKLLQWVQKRTRKFGVAVQDFGKSWTSGLAFLAVIKSIDSSLVDMRKALLRTARENLEDAFRIAHYSLGIPRLLEPEDVAINPPDEQSIMTYVSQFLEHFPGIEEAEQHCQLIERSVSMCRLNFRDSDMDFMKNGSNRSRVKERSYIFQRDCGQPPPKILVSSVSEDRSTVSTHHRRPAARSWSSEDILSDPPLTEDTSHRAVEEKKEPAACEDVINSTSPSPQLSYTQSPSGSSMPESVSESVIEDSAISSPDSWMESEYGVGAEKFCESRSDSSLCDSGTAWDVYRATPVEITTLDEGFVPSMEEKAPDDQSLTGSYIDEGIFSMGTVESSQEKSLSVNQVEEVMEKGTSSENHQQDMVLKQEPDQGEAEMTLVNHEHMETSPSQKDETPKKEETESGQCDEDTLPNSAEDLLKTEKTQQSQNISNKDPPHCDSSGETIQQNNVGESTLVDSQCLKTAVNIMEVVEDRERQATDQTEGCDEAEEKTECHKAHSSFSEKSGSLKDGHGEVVETKDKAGDSDEAESTGPPETPSSVPSASTNTHPSHQDGGSEMSSEVSTGLNIPLISISSEPEEHDHEGPERQGHNEDNEAHQSGEVDDLSSDQNPAEPPPCPASENVEAKISEELRDKKSGLDSADSPPQPMEQEMDSSDHMVDGHQHKLDNTCSPPTEQDTTDSVSNNMTGSSSETQAVSRDSDLFHADFDRRSPTDDLVGHSVEPMDLFYPDKEEPVFTEPPDAEMQSWPSVLSVSALQPAPASESSPDELLFTLHGDLKDEVHPSPEQDTMISETYRDTDSTFDLQKHSLQPGEGTGGLWGADVSVDGRDVSKAEQQSSDYARENTEAERNNTPSSCRQDESQIPPVLRHRKGLRVTAAVDNQTAKTGGADRDDSDQWWRENCELCVLLLLWLLLYCFWMLPQMDLKTLPNLLLNLHH